MFSDDAGSRQEQMMQELVTAAIADTEEGVELREDLRWKYRSRKWHEFFQNFAWAADLVETGRGGNSKMNASKFASTSGGEINQREEDVCWIGLACLHLVRLLYLASFQDKFATFFQPVDSFGSGAEQILPYLASIGTHRVPLQALVNNGWPLLHLLAELYDQIGHAAQQSSSTSSGNSSS